MKEESIKHLEWIYKRMENHHNENPKIDYMIKFSKILNELKEPQHQSDEAISYLKEMFNCTQGMIGDNVILSIPIELSLKIGGLLHNIALNAKFNKTNA